MTVALLQSWLPILACVAHQDPASPFRALTFDEACASAEKEGKVVFIDFFTTWCPPCKKLDAVTWKDAEVVRWLGEKTVALKRDAEEEEELAERFQLEAYPTLVFVRPDRSELGRLVGFHEPAKFLSAAADALAGKHPSDAKKAELDARGWSDPMLRQDYGDALVRERRYAEALEQYLWCFDHGVEQDRAYAGVRGSFLVSDIAELGRKHPPALTALRERREATRTPLLDGRASLEQAMAFNSINRGLGEARETLAMYDQLATVEQQRVNGFRLDPRKLFFDEVLPLLCEDKRYADALAGLGDPLKRLERELAKQKSMLAGASARDEEERAMNEKFQRMFALKALAPIYEALLGARHEAEPAFRARLLAFDGSPEARQTLAAHARRAGCEDIARELEPAPIK